MTYIKTKRLFLNGFDLNKHFPKLLEWLNDQENTHYMWQGHRPVSEEDIREWYGHDNDVIFIIGNEANSPIGVVGLYGINALTRLAELRIVIDKKQHGQGYGTEAIKAVVEFAFNNLNLHKVKLGVNAENLAAYNCYLKAGFKKEGELVDEIYRNGRYYNAIMMGVVRQ